MDSGIPPIQIPDVSVRASPEWHSGDVWPGSMVCGDRSSRTPPRCPVADFEILSGRVRICPRHPRSSARPGDWPPSECHSGGRALRVAPAHAPVWDFRVAGSPARIGWEWGLPNPNWWPGEGQASTEESHLGSGVVVGARWLSFLIFSSISVGWDLYRGRCGGDPSVKTMPPAPPVSGGSRSLRRRYDRAERGGLPPAPGSAKDHPRADRVVWLGASALPEVLRLPLDSLCSLGIAQDDVGGEGSNWNGG